MEYGYITNKQDNMIDIWNNLYMLTYDNININLHTKINILQTNNKTT